VSGSDPFSQTPFLKMDLPSLMPPTQQKLTRYGSGCLVFGIKTWPGKQCNRQTMLTHLRCQMSNADRNGILHSLAITGVTWLKLQIINTLIIAQAWLNSDAMMNSVFSKMKSTMRSIILIALICFNLFFQCCGGDRSCWERTIIGEAWNIEDVHGISGELAYAISSQRGGVFSYDGNSWKHMADSPSNMSIFSLSPNNIYAGDCHFDGSKWSSVLPAPYHISDIWASSENDVYMVSFTSSNDGPGQAKLFHYDGAGWSEIPNDFQTLLQGVWGSSADDVYTVGSGDPFPPNVIGPGKIFHFNGNTWEVVKDDIPYGLFGIWGSSPDDIFAVGGFGHILHYDGSDWSEMETPSDTHDLVGVWGMSHNQVYAVGSHILYYDGVEWSIVDNEPRVSSTYFESVWGTSATDVFVGGNYYDYDEYSTVGMILHYTCPRPGMSNKP